MTEIFPENLPQADFPQEMLAAGGYMTKAEEEKKKQADKKKKEKKRKKANKKKTDLITESQQKAAIKVQANVRSSPLLLFHTFCCYLHLLPTIGAEL